MHPQTNDSFSVTVNPQNDPPVTVGDELSVLEGGTVTVTTLGASSVLENDTDIEIGIPTASYLVTSPTFGTISLLQVLVPLFIYTTDPKQLVILLHTNLMTVLKMEIRQLLASQLPK